MLAGFVIGAGGATGLEARAADLAPVYKAPVLLDPAVDGFNSKWEALGGQLSRLDLYGYRGAFSIPLAQQWGLQVDTSFGSLDRRGFGSVAPHLFWRDPSKGLVGLYASHTHWDKFGGVHVTQVAGEFEYYFGRATFQGIAGVEFGNSVQDVTTTNFIVPPGPFIGGIGAPGVATTNTFIEGYDIKTRFFDQINFKYYFTDNFDGYVGHRYLGGKHALALGSEVAVPLGGGRMGSAFVEARLGEGSFTGVWGGLKIYLGQKDKTLIKRHRQDDPPFWDTLFSITNNHFTSGSSSSTQFCGTDALLSGGSCLEFGGGSS